ncbi:REP-associated tyrosine transposase [Thiohalophilus sp.]|uniref:REP-associated tyrosine transposase n=1 Tax=Thiohalophilus sp. TaxID=3028392 RepID=UPI002ACE4347|nr:transposase [Thiohalophilus sp.]MDZ7661969.1 transposase [Thiohalophilus sp.]
MTTHHFSGHRLRIGRLSETGRIYLITTVTEQRQPIFQNFLLGRLVVQALKDNQSNTTTLAYVVMPDHLHWVMQLGDRHDLSTVVSSIKSNSARWINRHLNRSGRLWQKGYHDHALRREDDLRQVARYVIANPLRAGLVRQIGDYPLWDAIWL